MGATRPLLGMALALAIALSVYVLGHLLARHRVPMLAGLPREGFAGWLLLLAAGQWLAVLLLLVALVRHLPLSADGGEPQQQLRLFGHILLLSLVLSSAILMTRKSRHYPRLLRLELVLLVLLPPIDTLWLTGENGAYVTEPKLWIAFAVRLAATGMFAAAWYLYSQHSRRMRATFVR